MTTRQAPADGTPRAPVPRDPIDQAVHDLRNGMNSMLMSAAVLGARIGEVPESLRPFVDQIAKSGQRCSKELADLYAMVDAIRKP